MTSVSMNLGRGGLPYQTSKTGYVITKHNTHCGKVPNAVLYPGAVALFNKHDRTNNIFTYDPIFHL